MRESHFTENPLGRLDWVLAGSLLCLVLAVGSWYVVPGAAGAFSDDGVYLATAKSLAEGTGYRLINLPGAPAQTKYPIAYPAFLAALWSVRPDFPANLVFLKFASLTCAGLAVGLAFLFLRRFGYASRGLAAGACLLAGTSPFFLYLGALTLSEPFFALVAVLALWALERGLADPASGGARWLFPAGLLAGLAFLCRLGGIMLVLTGAALVWRRAGRGRVRYLVGAGLCLAPWAAWLLVHRLHGPVDPALAYYSDYFGWWLAYGPAALVRVASINLLNLLELLVAIPALGLKETVTALVPGPVVVVPALALGTVVLWGMGVAAWRGRALALSLLACLALQVVWPWPLARFLAPFLPFFAYFLFAVCDKAARRVWSGRGRGLAGGLIVALLAGLNIGVAWQARRSIRASGYPVVFATAGLPAWDSYRDVFRWVDAHVPPTAVLASGLGSMTALYTGRATVRPFVADPLRLYYGQPGPALGDVDELLHRLRGLGVGYLLRLPMPEFGEEKPLSELLDRLETSRKGVLRRIYIGADPRFTVYALDWKAATPAATRNETAGAQAVQGLPPR